MLGALAAAATPALGPGVAAAYQSADRATLLREFPESLVEAMWIQDWRDLDQAWRQGRLVDVRSDPAGSGFALRLDGESRIGELEGDAWKQAALCRLTRPAAALLQRVADKVRDQEGAAFVPLEVTSLVRTWDYQLRLGDRNPNADTTREGVPPTHVLGVAFDIARGTMSSERQERIERILDDLAADGELAYYREGSTNGLAHYHVMALPSAETRLVRYLPRVAEPGLAEARGERANLRAEAPCVEFGASLEPFSAICSCELPLEAAVPSPPVAPN